MSPPLLHPDAFAAIVELALDEDLGREGSDLTALWVIPAAAQASATLLARRPGVLAGLQVGMAVFSRLSPQVHCTPLAEEGAALEPGQKVLDLAGPARALLAGERTALNFIQRLSGVATLTRAFVEAVAGTPARITDTRKTTPGLRALEKQAVVLGGGVNHRFGLYDAVLVKENHAATAGGVGAALRLARQGAREQGPRVRLMAEARNLDEVRSAAAADPDRILLDNMGTEELRQCVHFLRRQAPHIEIEATGDVTLANARQVAETGVDFISIGALTHSAPALNLSLLFAGT
ncbi:MAG: carboxylating nicotinate-nucleotide diphosphorylase [Candidatus Handelsmanbacteria bacterium]|nr:carboxylating nicotinate-nucleotide diphosphorylase [Candidatus Handelsmanbacteria bacterium]